MHPAVAPQAHSILIATDQPLLLEGLAAIIGGWRVHNYRVVRQCSTGEKAICAIEAEYPDIAVLDLDLADLSAFEIVRRVREAGLATRIVALSTLRDRSTMGEALRCGVNAFLLKSASLTQLLEALGKVLSGVTYVSPELEPRQIAPVGHASTPENPVGHLSAREHQVLSFLVKGTRAKEIAWRLELSPKTVDTFRSNLMRKLDIYDVAGLVKFAVRHNLECVRSNKEASPETACTSIPVLCPSST